MCFIYSCVARTVLPVVQATEARLEALEADNDVGNEQGAESDDDEFMVAGDEDEEEGG